MCSFGSSFVFCNNLELVNLHKQSHNSYSVFDSQDAILFGKVQTLHVKLPIFDSKKNRNKKTRSKWGHNFILGSVSLVDFRKNQFPWHNFLYPNSTLLHGIKNHFPLIFYFHICITIQGNEFQFFSMNQSIKINFTYSLLGRKCCNKLSLDFRLIVLLWL